ncbi:MAG: hypothetical protein HRT68_13425, partial [Flavobacteriaceae bacterium]|nr:hypothetical protein [Flavobacteriaceae bacterium]
ERVQLFIGDKDEYITEEIIASEKAFLTKLFEHKIYFTIFDGTHEVKPELLVNVLQSF